MNQLLGLADIGEFLGLHPNTGYQYSSKMKLPPADMLHGKRRLWEASTIREWARENRVGKFKFL